HWAIPRSIWNEREAAKKGKVVKQGTLDALVGKTAGPLVFNREDLLHTVTQFIAVDDQSLAVAGKTAFRNCLVAMRPKSISLNLPTTHDVVKHLHNEFVRWIDRLKQDIEV
ncbi:hypothetical protein L208DRAFT_1064199, partial [Tricholoma matsutake]